MLPMTFCLKIPVQASGEVDYKILSHELTSFKQVFKLLETEKD